MSQTIHRWPVLLALPIVLAIPSVGTAQAQSKPEILSTKEVALFYRSVFDGYQKYGDEPVAAWTQTNTTVGKIGGWRAYAKEARQPDQSEGVAPATNADAHSSHGGRP